MAAAVSVAPEAADLTALAEADSTLLDGLREDRCESAARLLLQADFMLCATGAGMSVGCGMSTYRTYSSTGEESAARVGGDSGDDGDSDYAGLLYEALASAETLRLDPAAFHAFMCSFFNDAQEARRTAGYRTLRAWQDCLFSSGRAFTFTS